MFSVSFTVKYTAFLKFPHQSAAIFGCIVTPRCEVNDPPETLDSKLCEIFCILCFANECKHLVSFHYLFIGSKCFSLYPCERFFFPAVRGQRYSSPGVI